MDEENIYVIIHMMLIFWVPATIVLVPTTLFFALYFYNILNNWQKKKNPNYIQR